MSWFAWDLRSYMCAWDVTKGDCENNECKYVMYLPVVVNIGVEVTDVVFAGIPA